MPLWAAYAAAPAPARALLVAETAPDGTLAPATKRALTACKGVAEEVAVLVTGAPGDGKVDEAAKEASRLQNVNKVHVARHEALRNAAPAPLAALVAGVVSKHGYTHAVASNGTFARDLMPRAAALLDSPVIADAVAVVDANTFVRPSYAGNAMERVARRGEGPVVVTFRPTAFDATQEGGGDAPIDEADAADAEASAGLSKFVGAETKDVGARADLTTARVVISGGRGVGDNFDKLYKLADAFGSDAAVGASRAAVDAGMCANDMQVGQTGKVVAPEVYIALGISGAIQHIAGMKDSKVVVAVNKDEDAPVFSVADVGLVGDVFKAVDRIAEELAKKKA